MCTAICMLHHLSVCFVTWWFFSLNSFLLCFRCHLYISCTSTSPCGIAHIICHHTFIMCSVFYINISRHTCSLYCYCLHQMITVLYRLLFAPNGELICEPHCNSFHMQCPHCQHDESVSEAEEIGGSYQLKKSHAHYYQVIA